MPYMSVTTIHKRDKSKGRKIFCVYFGGLNEGQGKVIDSLKINNEYFWHAN